MLKFKEMSMKILINMISLFQGGPKTVALGYLEGISEFIKENKEVEFTIIIPTVDEIINKAKKLDLYNKCNIITVEYPNVEPRFIYKLFYDHIYTPWISHKHKIDYIFMTANFASLFTRKKQIVLFHNLHYIENINPFESLKQKLKFILEKKLFFLTLKSKDPIYLVQTEFIKDKLSKHTKKIFLHRMIPPDNEFKCDEKNYKKVSEEFFKYGGYLKMFLPAKFHPNKNFWIISELAKYINENNLPIKIFLTLKEKEYKHLLNDDLEILKDIVVNLGEISYHEIRCYYENIDIVIFPSSSESYGFPIIESILTGKKIIVPDMPIYKELLKDKGYYFNLRNFTSLFELVQKFLLEKDNKIKYNLNYENCKWKNKIYEIVNLLKDIE
jgi:hypothetical protein